MRPLNVIFTGGVQVLFLVCFSSLDIIWAIPGIIGLMLLVASGNAINDYYDRTADWFNRPDTLILERHLQPKVGWLVFMVGATAGIALGWQQGPLMGWTYVIIASALWLYSRYLKRLPLIGNLWVASLLTLPLLVWCLWPQSVDCEAAIRYGVVVWSINALRELVKDQQDADGDRQAHFHTMPVVSPRWTRYIGHGLFGLTYLTLLGLLQWTFSSQQHFLWFMSILLGIFIPLLYLHFIWHHSHSPRQWKAIQHMLKILMAVGTLTLAWGC